MPLLASIVYAPLLESGRESMHIAKHFDRRSVQVEVVAQSATLGESVPDNTQLNPVRFVPSVGPTVCLVLQRPVSNVRYSQAERDRIPGSFARKDIDWFVA